MADYINIRGQNIEVVASDPANPTLGQIWYNSTSNTLKGLSLSTAGTWATGGALNNLRTQTNLMVAGTQTAAIVTSLTGTPSTTTTELYNGSAWTNSPATYPTTARFLNLMGTQTATITGGGVNEPPGVGSAVSASFNGTSWTANPSLNTARNTANGYGVSNTANTLAGGDNGGGLNSTETWNNVSWTTVPGTLSTGRPAGCNSIGSSKDAFLFVGGGPSPTQSVESWNGTTWTTIPGTPVTNQPTVRSSFGGAGNPTAAVVFGGNPPVYSGNTLNWNGTTWTANPNSMNVGSPNRAHVGGCGTQAAALAAGGENPVAGLATEEYTGPGAPLTVTITAS